jgi:hypothetical protein
MRMRTSLRNPMRNPMREPAGVWSANASGLHYDGFENETLTFGARGQGLLRFERPGYTDLVLFTWRRVSVQRISLLYRGRYETLGDSGRPAKLDTDTLPTLIRYHISDEDTPLAGRTTLLRIEPAILLAGEFGLLHR